LARAHDQGPLYILLMENSLMNRNTGRWRRSQRFGQTKPSAASYRQANWAKTKPPRPTVTWCQ